MNRSNRGMILLLIAVLGWFFVVRPQIDLFGQRSLDAKAKQDEVVSYDQRIKDIDFIREKGADFQKVLTAQYLAMPQSAQIPEVLVMIESLAASSGVALGSATVGNPDSNEVPVSISFTGSLGSVSSFLNTLNANIRTVLIKDQTMTADVSGNLTVTMQLGLVYQGGTL